MVLERNPKKIINVLNVLHDAVERLRTSYETLDEEYRLRNPHDGEPEPSKIRGVVKSLDRQTSVFSDSALISFSVGKSLRSNILIEIIGGVHEIQRRVEQTGVLLRGVITYGDVVHDGSKCFGEAVLRAQALEKDFVKDPKILIDTRITRDAELMRELRSESAHIQEMDGTRFISRFNWAIIIGNDVEFKARTLNRHTGAAEPTLRKVIISFMKDYSTLISDGLKFVPYPGKKKYEWLASEFETALDTLRRQMPLKDRECRYLAIAP